MGSQGNTPSFHSAHILESVTIHYRWLSYHGKSLPVRARYRRSHGADLCLEVGGGVSVGLPEWMADARICSSQTVGSPQVTIEALEALDELLGAVIKDAGHEA